MFQITRRADYAVRIMLELGQLDEGQRLPAGQVAAATGVPQPFLHKIVADLVEVGLIRTYLGPGGGLALARPAAGISMLDIVEAIEGPVCLNTCLIRPQECTRDVVCPAHGFWAGLQAEVASRLRGARLDRLVAEARRLKRRPRAAEFWPPLPKDAEAGKP